MTTPSGLGPATTPLPWQPAFTVPDPNHSGWIYAANARGTTGQLFLSKDWGSIWVQVASPNSGNTLSGSAISLLLPDPDVSGRLYAVDIRGVFYFSSDGAASWQTYQKNLPTRSLIALSRSYGGGVLLSGEWLSLNFGATWQSSSLNQSSIVASGPGCALYGIPVLRSDAFVAKLAPGGATVLWSTYLGGSSVEAATAIGVDGRGNVYVTGTTFSTDFPGAGAHGYSNVFLTKYDPNGTIQTQP